MWARLKILIKIFGVKIFNLFLTLPQNLNKFFVTRTKRRFLTESHRVDTRKSSGGLRDLEDWSRETLSSTVLDPKVESRGRLHRSNGERIPGTISCHGKTDENCSAVREPPPQCPRWPLTKRESYQVSGCLRWVTRSTIVRRQLSRLLTSSLKREGSN